MPTYIDWNLRRTTQVVEKGWGREIIFTNTDKYTGKLLEFHEVGKLSMHFHIKKDETWYVVKGKFMLSSIDPKTAEETNVELNVGDVIHLPPGVVHRLFAYEDSTIFEVSTPDDPEDSYRIKPGDSQAEKKS